MRAYISEIAGFRREIKLFLIYNLFANIGIGVFTLIFNLYLVQLSLQEDFIGVYNAASTVTMGVISLVMGILINRYGSWRVIFLGTILFLVSSVALSLLGTPAPILMMGILAGAGTAFIFVPVMPFIVEYSNPQNRSTIAALSFSLTSLSMTLGSLVGGWSPRLFWILFDVELGGIISYRLTLLAGLALAAIGLIPLWLMRSARHSRAGETGQIAMMTELPAGRRQVRRDLGVFVVVGLLLSLGAGAIIPFYNVYLQSIGARPSEIGMIFSLAGVVAAVAGLFAPALAKRMGPLTAVLLLRVSPIPAFFLLAFFPHLGIAVLAHVIRTTSISMAWPIDSTFIADVLPARARASAFSIRSGAWNLGFAFSSFVAGQIIVTSGYAPTFFIFGIFALMSTLTFFLYFRRQAVEQAEAVPAARPAASASTD